jgi:hypothetical protein
MKREFPSVSIAKALSKVLWVGALGMYVQSDMIMEIFLILEKSFEINDLIFYFKKVQKYEWIKLEVDRRTIQ